jgi:hypothetical protein
MAYRPVGFGNNLYVGNGFTNGIEFDNNGRGVKGYKKQHNNINGVSCGI